MLKKTVKAGYLFNPSIPNTRVLTGKYFAIPALFTIDLLAVVTSLLVAFYFRAYLLQSLFPTLFKEKLLSGTVETIWWFPLVMLFCLVYENLYAKRLPFWTEVELILKAATLAVFFSVVVLYLTKATGEVSRTLIIIVWCFEVFLLPLFRYYGKLLLIKMNIWKRPVIIVGNGEMSHLIARALEREKTIGYEIIGALEGEKKETNNRAGSKMYFPFLGTIDEAEKVVAFTGVKDIIIAMSGLPSRHLVELANRLQPVVGNILLVPDLFGLSLSGIEAEYFFEEQTLLLHIKNRLKSLFNRCLKRVFDLLLGSMLLVLSIPVLLVVALAIRLDSRGPVFFKQPRLGQGGSTFICFKFRTMYLNADNILREHLLSNLEARQEWEKYNKLLGYDPRVTRIGKIMRKFSLDELPQILNVLRGEMSLVGPRPYLPREKEQMGDWLHDIVVAKPGLTGLWQVSGRNQISFEGRLKLDSWYMKNWSLWLDLVLLLKTIRVVVKREGAH